MPLGKSDGNRPNPPECALCGVRLTRDNDSREHVIPNAIGGRRVVIGFICKPCNDKTGSTWDRALTDPLQPFCNLLNIRRQRGHTPPVRVRTVGGDAFDLHVGGALTLPRAVVKETPSGEKIRIQIKARSMSEFEKHARGVARKYPQFDVAQALLEAQRTQEITGPVEIPSHFGGLAAGRSIVKSVVALAFEAGIQIEECEHAREYLLSGGNPCFGYFNDVDVVSNRPTGVFFHCVFVRGDPETKQLLGYVEYFGYQRIVVCLSSNYDGDEFSCCYAVDPVSGDTLELRVELKLTPRDIRDIYEYKRLSREVLTASIDSLLGYWQAQREYSVFLEARDEGIEYALAETGIEGSRCISEEQARRFVEVFTDRLRSGFERKLSRLRFSADDLRKILQAIRDKDET